MDFIVANHSLEYGTIEEIRQSIRKLSDALKSGRPFLVRVVSTQHPFAKARPEEIYGFSHVGFCVQNSLPVHFFEEEELRKLFRKYRIERLEHITHPIEHERISVPLREWVLLTYKQ